MPISQKPRLLVPKYDPYLEAAGERVKAAAEELERLGIADHTGKRLRDDIPEDMRETAHRDFGG
jgi:hypothetical protein